MEFRLLGALEVCAAGVPVGTGTPRQRAVLAALAVDAGRPVRGETIVDRVWGMEPPPRVRQAVYTYIARIRRSGGGAAVPIIRRGGGYQLDVAPGQVDVFAFRDLVARAHAAAGDGPSQAELLRRALSLWRGTPLADLPGDWAASTRLRWEQEYVAAAVAWAEAELAGGNGAAVLAPLAELADRHPLAESLVAAQMRALTASGNGAAALGVFARIRERLAEELGTEPGEPLREVHRAVLRGGWHPGPAVAPAPAPAQLPREPPGFVGRAAERAVLDRLVAGDLAERSTPLVAIWGTAGAGKTALAVHWAHRHRHRFPGGQLYVDLRGFGPGEPVSPGQAVRSFLDALGVAHQRVPNDLDGQAALYRTVLADRRVLIVADNARDADQVRPLLPGTPGCFVVVTSRVTLTGLVAVDGAHPVPVGLLSNADCRDMLAARLGGDRVAQEPAAVDAIVARCARLPLALAVAAGYAAVRPGTPLAALAEELCRDADSLPALSADDALADVRAVFSWSYRCLSAAAARTFTVIGLHVGQFLSTAAAASLAGVAVDHVRPALAELLRANLLRERAPDRYVMHDLLRSYARELAHAQRDEANRLAAVRRLVDHYLHTAAAADRLMNPYRDPLDLGPPAPGVTVERPADLGEAIAWFRREHAAVLAAAALAADLGPAGRPWQLAWAAATYLDRFGYWRDWATVGQLALDVAHRDADGLGQAYSHAELAGALGWLGGSAQAVDNFGDALARFTALGDQAGRARAHAGLAWALDLEGRHAEALTEMTRALALYRSAGFGYGVANAVAWLGWHHTQLGRHHDALRHARHGLRLQQEAGDRRGQAVTWAILGTAHRRLGHLDDAVGSFARAAELLDDAGERGYLAQCLTDLGEALRAGGNVRAAEAAWRRAATILDDIDPARAVALQERLMAAR